MFSKVEFENFKSLRSVSLQLEPFTILVGANGAGKTSVLQGLHYLCEILRADLQVASFLSGSREPYELISRSADPGSPVVITIGDHRGQVSLVISGVSEDPGTWKAAIRGKWEGLEVDGEPSRGRANISGFPRSVLQHLDPDELAAPFLSEERRVEMSPSGKGLAGVLADLALSDPDRFELIQERLRRVIPEVERIRFRRAPIPYVHVGGSGERWGQQLVFDMRRARGLSAHHASEGALIVLALVTILSDRRRPGLLLLDDLARGLHPGAQGDLVGVLREIQRDELPVQIVATLHSPYMLDHFAPEEVRMTCLAGDGTAIWSPLLDHPEWLKWKDQMKAGEFWSTFGESWIAGAGRAAR